MSKLPIVDQDLKKSDDFKDNFKQFLVGHNLDKLNNKSVVLVIGPTRAGKSTTVNILNGSIYKLNQKGEYTLVDSDGKPTSITSHGYMSTTLNLGVYEDKKNELTYVDTAGLCENRGEAAKLWTQSNLGVFFSIVGEIKSLVLVMRFSATFLPGGKGLEELAEELFKAKVSTESFYKSMVFVITDAYKGKTKVTLKSLIEAAEEKLAAVKEQAREEENRLAKKYPKKLGMKVMSGMIAVGTAFTKSAFSDDTIAGEEPAFDVHAIPEEKKAEELRTLNGYIYTRRLLEILIASSPGKIVISDPDGADACREVQTGLLKIIRSTPAVTREILLNIKKTFVDNHLQLFSHLSSIARDYLILTGQAADVLTTLVRNCDEEKGHLDGIERDWSATKKYLCLEKEKSKSEKEFARKSKREERSKLEKSVKPVVYDDHHILKTVSYGFLGLKWLFRAAYATEQYTYAKNPLLPFVGHNYDESEEKRFTPTFLKNNQSTGELSIKFESDHGVDLNLKVKVFICEKNHPDTKDEIERLGGKDGEGGEIGNLKKEIEVLRGQIISLNSAGSADDLRKEFLREFENDVKKAESIASNFKKEIQNKNGISIKEWDAIKKLESFFKLMKECKIEHPDLVDSNKDTIKDFLEHCSTIKEKSQNKYVKDLLPFIAKSQTVTNTTGLETVDPIGSVGGMLTSSSSSSSSFSMPTVSPAEKELKYEGTNASVSASQSSPVSSSMSSELKSLDAFKKELRTLLEEQYRFSIKRSSTDTLLIEFDPESEVKGAPKTIQKKLKKLIDLLKLAIAEKGIKENQYEMTDLEENKLIIKEKESEVLDDIAELLEDAGRPKKDTSYFKGPLSQVRAALFGSKKSKSVESGEPELEPTVNCSMQ